MSREHAITTSAQGLVSITGGKLTTYRVMAADVVDTVLARLRRRNPGQPTKTTPLPGGDFDSLEALVATIARETNDVALAEHLAGSHGSRWREVWKEIANHGRERIADSVPYTAGELRYSVRREMALTIGDLLIRRTHLAFETRDHGIAAAPGVAELIAPLVGWDFAGQRRAVEEYESEVSRIFSIGASVGL